MIAESVALFLFVVTWANGHPHYVEAEFRQPEAMVVIARPAMEQVSAKACLAYRRDITLYRGVCVNVRTGEVLP